MTDWKVVRGSQSERPLEVEENTSTVYLRRNIEQVVIADVTTEEEVTLWEYEEKEMSKSEYAQYLMVKESTDTITNYQKQDTIDAYTEELIEQGVI